MLALFVDKELNLLAVHTVARRDVAGVNLPTAQIVCRGHALGAAEFFLVHNHPSGDPQPSKSDVRVTNRLRRLSAELEMPLIAHCIVAGSEIQTVGGLDLGRDSAPPPGALI